MNLLRGENIRFSYGKREILKGINLYLRAGEMTGLVGANGAGKSTLLKCLAGGLTGFSGEIFLREKSSRSLSALEKARFMGYLPQERQVHWDLNCEQVVALGRNPYLRAFQALSARDYAAVSGAMRETDTADYGARGILELAEGEKARVLLARVLAGEPGLILADEPAAGLDPAHQLRVMRLLRARADQGAGVLTVLHDLNLAITFCQRVILMHEGSILAEGSPAQVSTPENLTLAYGVKPRFYQDAGHSFLRFLENDS